MEPPTRLAQTARDALSSPGALAAVATAVERDGIAVLGSEFGLTPGDLVAFMQRLSVATGGDGELMEVISDIKHAAAATEPPNTALILSNIRLDTAEADRLQASGEGYLGKITKQSAPLCDLRGHFWGHLCTRLRVAAGQNPAGAPAGVNTIRGAGGAGEADSLKNYLGSPPGRAAVWHQVRFSVDFLLVSDRSSD